MSVPCSTGWRKRTGISPTAASVAASFLGFSLSSFTSETIFQVAALLESLNFHPDMSLLISGLPPSAASSAARARWLKMLREITRANERIVLVRMAGNCSGRRWWRKEAVQLRQLRRIELQVNRARVARASSQAQIDRQWRRPYRISID